MNSKKKVAIVVLNYLNYNDTIECVDSILKHKYDISGIVIVDNASSNESYHVLGKRYKNNSNIFVLRTKENLGYAKGNNVGIRYARNKLGAEYVLVVNNDTIFTDGDYINKLVKVHKPGIAVIGGKIITADNKIDGVLLFEMSWRYFISLYCEFIMALARERKISWPRVGEEKKCWTINGAALMFTPDYLNVYDGFYPKTFLYGEEKILFMRCERHNLKMKLAKDAEIYHKENKSSDISFDNKNRDRCKCYINSYKYVLINLVINKVVILWRKLYEKF